MIKIGYVCMCARWARKLLLTILKVCEMCGGTEVCLAEPFCSFVNLNARSKLQVNAKVDIELHSKETQKTTEARLSC